ncbi:MAG: extracellular solute-binding protein, partial [Candidatus Thiodiazotropha endolucinida]|nr:extracellular solute-binding protein [Candidatus Thiodiazotropha taylori]MCW4239217.1 extracellular solute-binding protein [Candidatus Thiodiazotropha endolucinida]
MLTFIAPSLSLADEVVNLYSARKEQLIKPLLDRFSEQTGIKVNLVTGKADALLQRLQSEGRNTPADMLITTDAGRLHRAKAAGVTQAVESKVLRDVVPES